MLVVGENGAGLAPFMFTVDSDAKIRLLLTTCIVKTAKIP